MNLNDARRTVRCANSDATGEPCGRLGCMALAMSARRRSAVQQPLGRSTNRCAAVRLARTRMTRGASAPATTAWSEFAREGVVPPDQTRCDVSASLSPCPTPVDEGLLGLIARDSKAHGCSFTDGVPNNRFRPQEA